MPKLKISWSRTDGFYVDYLRKVFFLNSHFVTHCLKVFCYLFQWFWLVPLAVADSSFSFLQHNLSSVSVLWHWWERIRWEKVEPHKERQYIRTHRNSMRDNRMPVLTRCIPKLTTNTIVWKEERERMCWHESWKVFFVLSGILLERSWILVISWIFDELKVMGQKTTAPIKSNSTNSMVRNAKLE